MKLSRKSRWFMIVLVFAATATGIGFVLAQTAAPPQNQAPSDFNINDKHEVLTNDAGLRYVVDPALLMAGGPPRDGIPSIDGPSFVSVETADEWIADDELVLALIYKGVKRVYPLQILVWHEIVNDVVAGDPLLISYCPLCGSGIAYLRQLDGQAVEFGTSGMLYNSNLVMYDRKTETYWSQIDGLAIVGELSGQELESICLDTVVWQEWKIAHPDSEVLSQDTGFDRDYGRDPYGSYHEDSFIWFPVQARDDRVHPKTVVFGIEINGAYSAYREEDLIDLGFIEDRVNGVRIRISRDVSGLVSVLNVSTQEPLVKERDFWFAWVAFHPNTRLYLPSD
jgi:uncharacterized protein DUF3179